MKVVLKPVLLKWARERASLNLNELASRMGVTSRRVVQWETNGELTYKQAEKLARSTHTPFGYLFLSAPPEEKIPIPDFRTVGNQEIQHPSPDLLDTIYQCQRQQDWYRSYLVDDGADPLTFVGSANTRDSVMAVAGSIRSELKLDSSERVAARTWEDALRMMFRHAEEAGILVMRSSVVGNNNHRKLTVDEFRGFTLCDDLAPLIFINSADSKSAQMFTLAHELAHVWLGQSGVSNQTVITTGEQSVERFCNAVAAEVLIPLPDVKVAWQTNEEPDVAIIRLANRYKVSRLVAIRRAHDAGFISRDEMQDIYDAEIRRLNAIAGSTGGDFYRTQGSRLGHRFSTALVLSALEGKTLYGDAFHLLGVTKYETFQELARSLQIPI
jgi:Zn-dependent peptidase ImmA (M78 family)/DNA-binding XRE family transcriptional regulator